MISAIGFLLFVFGSIVIIGWMISMRSFHKAQEESVERCYKVLRGEKE